MRDLLSALFAKERRFSHPVVVQMSGVADLEKLGFITQEDLAELGLPGEGRGLFPPLLQLLGGALHRAARAGARRGVSAQAAMKFIVSGGMIHLRDHRECLLQEDVEPEVDLDEIRAQQQQPQGKVGSPPGRLRAANPSRGENGRPREDQQQGADGEVARVAAPSCPREERGDQTRQVGRRQQGREERPERAVPFDHAEIRQHARDRLCRIRQPSGPLVRERDEQRRAGENVRELEGEIAPSDTMGSAGPPATRRHL